MFPPGKKPIIISIDDLNYYDYMIENGNVFRLILDENGDIATYSVSPKGEAVISYDNEIIPILDNFIKEHEDFSLQGAKGIIGLTGYQGILGYRTNDVDSAYGSSLSPRDPKFKFLLESGFKVFYSVGPKPYERFDGNFIEMDRGHIDGMALKTQSKMLLALFDAREVVDNVRPAL